MLPTALASPAFSKRHPKPFKISSKLSVIVDTPGDPRQDDKSEESPHQLPHSIQWAFLVGDSFMSC